MSNQSNNQGRAYEYICLLTLNDEINKIRPSIIIENSAFIAAQNAWNSIDMDFQRILSESAFAAVATIFDMEPLIIEKENDDNTIINEDDNSVSVFACYNFMVLDVIII